MSNIRRVTKSTNCVDCYNNNPFQQNEGLKSYAKMISNHTNTESCKSCEPCYDPYLKKVFTEGCLTGEGTECNPLSINLDCIPSGGVSSCTMFEESCNYEVSGINLCQQYLEVFFQDFTCPQFTFDTFFTFSITFSNLSIYTFSADYDLAYLATNRSEFLGAIQVGLDNNPPPSDIIIEVKENSVKVTYLSCIPNTVSMNWVIFNNSGFDFGINAFDYALYSYGNVSSIGSDQWVLDAEEPQLNTFQVLINDTWTDVTDEVVEGTWAQENSTDTITEWRITSPAENEEGFIILDSGNVTSECQESEITKSICEWIDYLYNQSSSGSENIYTSDGESTDSLRTAIFQGLKFETSSEDEYGFHIESNTVNRSGFRVDAESQEDYGIYLKGISQITDGINISGESYGTESGVEISGYTIGGVGILLNGYSSANNNGINLQAYSEEQDALYLSGQTNNVALADIVISPFNGKLQFDNIQEVTGASYYYVEDSEGYTRKIEYTSPSGENLYNSNGTLISNRTLEGDDKTLFFQNLRSFGVEAQPQDNDTYGIALGNNQGGSPLSLAGIILGGVGKNQGIVLTGLTTGDDGSGTSAIQITGENSNALANDITFTPQNGRLKISSLPTDNTALQVASKDSNDRLVWRDVSSIASSLPSNVCQMIGIDFTKTSTTTNAADQVIGHVLIPANTFGTGSSLIEVESCISRLVAGASPNHRLFINTSTSFSGATLLATFSSTTTLKYCKAERTFECGSNFIRGFHSGTTSLIDDVLTISPTTQTTVNWAVDQYILTTINNTTGETTQHELTSVELKKV